MDFGIFTTPYAIPYRLGQRTAPEVIDWDLNIASWADQYGLREVLFAEHYTIGHEPSPAPEIMIAAASQRTERVRLGAAAHLLPYHNPISLAHRLMWLDHMTKGRYIAGFAPGSFPTDAQLFATGDNNPEMFAEGLDIVEAIWMQEPPFRIDGKYWTVDMPEYTEQWGGPHQKPFQRPRPEVLLTGMQAKSPTFAEAAKRGYSPMSQELGNATLRSHWEYYSEVAAEHGRIANRANWRIMRDIFVAETDEEARRLVIDGAMGRSWNSHILPAFKVIRSRGSSKPYAFGQLIVDEGMEMDELTIEWLTDNFWLVGSPDTVVEKVTRLDEELGGIGCILSLAFDYSDNPEPYRRNIELLATEVMPRLADVGARATTAA